MKVVITHTYMYIVIIILRGLPLLSTMHPCMATNYTHT